MKESLKKEYDALGLPWKKSGYSELDITCICKENDDFPVFTNETDSVEIAEFAVKAANSHHALVDQVERLRDALKEILECENISGEQTNFYVKEIVQEALKDSV